MVPKTGVGANEGSGIREKEVYEMKGRIPSEIKMCLCCLSTTNFLVGEPMHEINDLTQTS